MNPTLTSALLLVGAAAAATLGRHRRQQPASPMDDKPGTAPADEAPPESPEKPPHELDTPCPARFELAERASLGEQEERLRRLAAEDADFARLCRLFREGGSPEEQEAFMHDAAAEYLRLHGQPGGGEPPHSLLLEAGADESFWFAGDIHGSLDALLRLYAYVHGEGTATGPQHLILLGDILDRGRQTLGTLALLLHLLCHPTPGLRLTLLCGNHDCGLYAQGERFASVVSPAESVDELDRLLDSNEPRRRELGRLLGLAALRLAERCPCMAEITGLEPGQPSRTLLCTHGGLPHTDLQAKLAHAEEGRERPAAQRPYLASIPGELREEFARDYCWIRLVDKVPRKQPNRGSKGCQMGTRDVDDYRLQHWQRSGRAVGYIIRGHDHEQAGWALYSYDAEHNPVRGKFVQRRCGVLTLNAMDPDASSGGLFRQRDIGLAGCRAGGPLRLTPLQGIPLENTPGHED